jgi:carboxypeptidase C (cathepsin A)
VEFKQFSGYVTLPNGHGKLFYWYVESQGDPDTDPLVWWTNGGPGCSGLTGLLTENGPFRANKDNTLSENPYAWNKFTNMVFIEQPVGVGFSQASGNITYGDEMAALDNHAFLLGFFDIFPDLKSRPLYLTSESYGGHYLPTLAKEIVSQGILNNFKGFAVGNPLTYMPYRDYGQWGTFWGHQLLPLPLWEAYNAANCKTDENSAKCQAITDQMADLTQDLDPYALDFPVCVEDGMAAGRHERYNILSIIRRAKRSRLGGYFPDNYEPCSDAYATDYLNLPSVQTALHAAHVTWNECSDDVNLNWNVTDLFEPMMPIYEFLLQNADLNIMVYSGNDDSVCATLGSQQFIWDTFTEIQSDPWRPWTNDQQVAGYTQGFQGFRFTTVNGAGHMVPATRPAQALEMFRKYLAEEW